MLGWKNEDIVDTKTRFVGMTRILLPKDHNTMKDYPTGYILSIWPAHSLGINIFQMPIQNVDI